MTPTSRKRPGSRRKRECANSHASDDVNEDVNGDYAGDVSEDGYDVIDISSDDEEAIVFGDGTVAISNSTTVIQKIVMTFTRRYSVCSMERNSK